MPETVITATRTGGVQLTVYSLAQLLLPVFLVVHGRHVGAGLRETKAATVQPAVQGSKVRQAAR
jgi:hypothetical protein